MPLLNFDYPQHTNIKMPLKLQDTSKKRAKWTEQMRKILVAALVNEKHNGYQAQSGWKADVWPRCAAVLKENGFELSSQQCEDQYSKVCNQLHLCFYSSFY